MSKQRRQQTILGLIRAKRISTQQELMDELARAGHTVNQSSVSRDLEALGIVKAHGHYVQQPREASSGLTIQALEAASGSLLVLRCETGQALAIAYQLDRAGLPGVVGTVAGLDTVFIAIREAREAAAVQARIRALFDQEVLS